MNIILDKIYNELKRLKKVASKGDFADKLNYNRTYVSEILNSEEQAIPEKLSIGLQNIFGINPKFIETGTGEMFTTKPSVGDTKSPQPLGKVAKWVFDMRDEFYKKVYDKKYPKTAIEIEIDMMMEELEQLKELARKEKEGED